MRRSPLSESEISRQSRIAIGLLRRYVRGQVSVGERNAKRLAPVLGVEPAHLVWGTPKQPPSPPAEQH